VITGTSASRPTTGARPQRDTRLISLIAPVYNEQESIVPFLDRIAAVFTDIGPAYDYQVLFVNDGSQDATEFAIRSKMQTDTRIGLLNLSRNFGKEAALSAGLDHADGDACIPIDVDLQDPPELIAENERVRFNKALFNWVGFDTAEVTFERPGRQAGSSAWSYWKLWNFALDGIFSSSTTPLRIWTYVGGTLAALSVVYAALIFIRTLFVGVDVPGYASTIILILLFGGMNLFAIGIVGEYIGRIYSEVRERPLYVLRSVHKAGDKD